MPNPTREYPPIGELIPHSRSMCLLDRVIHKDEDQTQCTMVVSKTDPFADASGNVPAYIGIEYMSQCAAAHSGLKARDEKGETVPKVAFLLGSRKVEMLVEAFPAGQILLIQASRIANTTDSAIFTGVIRDSVSGTLLMKAQLMFHEPDVLEPEKQP